MTYELLKFAHIVGLALISGGLIGVWMFDLRSRQLTRIMQRRLVDMAQAADLT